MNHSKINEDVVLEEASQWHFRLLADDVAEDEKNKFKLWLKQSDLHRECYESIVHISQQVDVLGNLTIEGSVRLPTEFIETSKNFKQSFFSSLSEEKSAKRKNYWWLSAAAVACLIVLIGYQQTRFIEPQQVVSAQKFQVESGIIYKTAKGDTRVITLTDGSLVHLNSNSMISVFMDKDKRTVIQQKGEIYYDIEKDKARPFTVEAAGHKITAVGTEFNIKYRKDDNLFVTITEGIVRVIKDENTENLDGNILKVGYQAIVNKSETEIVEFDKQKLHEILAWKQRKLIFTEATLLDVISEMANYTNRKIIISSKELENKRLSGVFNIHDINSIFRAIELALGVEVKQYDDVIVIVKV
jgi:transmembrane sensor